MIEPVHRLLQQLAQDQRSGMLLLVMVASGSASHIVTLWLHEGELVHISDRLRRGAAALVLLQKARLLRRWQWFALQAPPALERHELPCLAEFLRFNEGQLLSPADPARVITLDHLRLERLFSIQGFMQSMAGAQGDDDFMQLLFDHPPTTAWDELMEAFRDHLSVYFGPQVAAQVLDA